MDLNVINKKKMKRHHIFIIHENELIIKEILDNKEQEYIQEIFCDSFGKNINYFELIGKRLYQITKGQNKLFGYNDYLDFELGFYYLCDNYSIFNESEEFQLLMSEFYCYHEEYINSIEFVKTITTKPIVIDKWKHKINIHKIETFLRIVDPTKNQKYLNWLCYIEYNNVFIITEDYAKIKTLLKDFDKPQVKALIKKAGYSIDIMDYKNNNDLWKTVNECYYSKLEDVEAGNRKILYQKRKVFEDENWLVVIPQSHEEAVTLGRGTNWCTSADSKEGAENYKLYTTHEDTGAHNDLIIFINKNYDTQKFQYVNENGLEIFLDWNDEEFEAEDFFNFEFVEKYYETFQNIPTTFKEILYINNHVKYKEFIIYYEGFDALEIKKDLIKEGKDLEILVNDKAVTTKLELIKNGYFLDKFKDDPNYLVRKKVAEMGYALDELMYDKANLVRGEVAKLGYDYEYFLESDDDLKNRNIGRHFNNLVVLNQITFKENKYGYLVADI